MAIKCTTLKNGIRVLTDERESAQMISVEMYVQTGSKDEPKSQKGIAHFIEHMMFRGTKDMDSEKLRKSFADLGVYHNGGTSNTYTDYYISVLKIDFDKGAKLLAKMLTEPAFEEKGFQIEKGVVINEIKQAPDNMNRKYWRFTQQSIYPNTPLALDGLGTEKIIQGLKANELRQYWRNHYTTDRIILVARGGITHPKFVNFCDQNFNKFVQRKSKISKFHFKSVSGLKKKIEPKQNQIWQTVAFPYDEPAEKDYYAKKLLMAVLSGGSSSRLWFKIREDRGLAYEVNSRKVIYPQFGFYGVFVKNKPDNTTEVLKLICEECHKIQSDATQEELDRVKKEYLVSLASNDDYLSSRAIDIADSLDTFGHVVQPGDLVRGYESVTLKDIKRVAKKMFSRAPTVVIMGPKCKTPTYKTICKWLKGE